MNGYHGSLASLPTYKTGKERSLIIAYVLWFFFGLIGAHRHYMGSKIGGWAQTAFFALSILWLTISLPMAFLGMIVLGILCAWVLLDLFLIPFML